MVDISEAAAASLPLGTTLAAGVDQISSSQTVTFTKYVRLVLPLDGFVFWVAASMVSPSAVFNAMQFNGAPFNAGQAVAVPAPTLTVPGSLHYATDMRQNEDETLAINRVVFTSEKPVDDFNGVGPNVMYIGTFQGVRFAFSQRKSFYYQASLWHYAGDAIYPDMETQIIDDPRGFDTHSLIVSNSLPVWLTLNKFMPMYPSFAVPANVLPPYGAVHIEPTNTTALQAFPSKDASGSHFQLVQDKVRLTTYGLRNNEALDFQDYVTQYSLDTDNIGIMNTPAFRDEKRTQVELGILAQKKTVEFDVSYYQTRIADVARQLILHATMNFNFN